MALETPSRPLPFMANAILNFHFDYLTTSLKEVLYVKAKNVEYIKYLNRNAAF